MNKKIIAGAALSAVLIASSATSAFAVTASPAVGERKMLIQQNTQARQEARGEKRDAALERIAGRVDVRFHHHEERLNNWLDRASKHIATREAAGKDMTAAKAAVTTAKADLATAVTMGNDAIAKLKAVQPGNWEAQKADALAAREAVNKAQLAYLQVVKDMQAVLAALKAVK